MRSRALVLIAMFTLAAAGCGSTDADQATTTAIGAAGSTTAVEGEPEPSTTATPEMMTTEAPTTAEVTTSGPPASTTTAAPATTRVGVDGLPAGWFCRDMAAAGYSYADAVAYWVSEGSPDRMDADGNGIPCETVYPESDVLAFWGDPLPTTTTMGGIEAVWWFSPMEPWEYPIPMSSDLSLYGSGCSPGTTTLPDGMWFGFVMRSVDEEIQFDLACLEVPDEGHATVRNDNATPRTVGVADGTVVHVLRMGGEFGGVLSFDEWRARGCTTGVDACPMWLFVNDGVVTDMVEVRLGPA